MTSTNINVGLDNSTRLASRVLKPPGGGHTDIFGAVETQKPRARKQQTSSIVLGTENCNEEKPTNGGIAAAAVDANENTSPAVAVAREESKPETEAKPEMVAEPPKPEPPRRIRVPPGGFTSGSFW